MQHLIEIGVFLGKAGILVGLFLLAVIVIAGLLARLKAGRENIEIEDLNEKIDSFGLALKGAISPRKNFKAELKAHKKRTKSEALRKSEKKNIFVLDFIGDLRASGVDSLRDEVNTILAVATPDRDEVVVRLESGGGMVHSYGLAAAQLLRLRDANLKLTVSVDKIAASGGYMMACTAHQILAAPFAILGSIGVIAQVPNLHRLLKKHDIDYEEITAGEFKRTVSLFGEITDKGRQKFLQQIEDTHLLFKEFVNKLRPKIELSAVATGEYWYGERAMNMGLIDRIVSSDEYLFEQRHTANLVKVQVTLKKPFSEKLSEALSKALVSGMDRWWRGLNEGAGPS